MEKETTFQPKNEKELNFSRKIAEEQKTLKEAKKTLDHVKVMKSGFNMLIKRHGKSIKDKTWKEIEDNIDDFVPKEEQGWGKELGNAVRGISDKKSVFNFENEKISDILGGLDEAESKLENTIDNIEGGKINVSS
ncbi:hypothetical protein A2303_07155 [Candidatus Falkowbacteria bacterium RIFOXYB2_FULL_47_14]|uniref:Uncharacterized protein n=1 Tax=Candidatus Falkowbacteria bacterium RIFOXYA2_FULL_47_19 TaxID=1797994 RepID=A0A1F5SGC7_9BACT|nr:MAG: hypothetical protein A2227_00900 [Candidatus Falkowbacteria bacterium RIFOXYA2_FULL_47_19]OGF34927.1 MAG: hypothetical protein A2468_06860 [Candidatus Falkowbacteria bacterium RIFOXYC2_FULL_46_15]OGF43642.1 MAG: hypothetical protein A2303_07155 [Candidatus Falkowbacteria bacterium RIFOXYB2_FULL_47_14]